MRVTATDSTTAVLMTTCHHLCPVVEVEEQVDTSAWCQVHKMVNSYSYAYLHLLQDQKHGALLKMIVWRAGCGIKTVLYKYRVQCFFVEEIKRDE